MNVLSQCPYEHFGTVLRAVIRARRVLSKSTDTKVNESVLVTGNISISMIEKKP